MTNRTHSSLQQLSNLVRFTCFWRLTFFPTLLSTLLILAGLPLFLRMPMWCDISLYDMAARTILTGGVHYRDLFDTNFPGYVWLLAGVRYLVGWSSEALRVVDLLFFAVTMLVLDRFAKTAGANSLARRWAFAGGCGFYLFSSEFNHAQRDVWLGLPAILAAYLRVRRLVQDSPGKVFLPGVLEGVLWGVAVWIKPHLLVVAVPFWLATVEHLALKSPRKGRAMLLDFLGNLLGGALLGAIGIVALVKSGTWPHFWAVMTEWNPAYSQKAFQELGYRVKQELYWFPPWSVFLPVTLLLALLAIVDARTSSHLNASGETPSATFIRRVFAALIVLLIAPYRFAVIVLVNPVTPLVPYWVHSLSDRCRALVYEPSSDARIRTARGALAVLYVVWAAQSFFLQRAFLYVHVVELFLMLALWSAHRWCFPALVFLWFAITSTVMIFAEPGTPLRGKIDHFERIVEPGLPYHYFVRHPLTDSRRMQHWSTCFRTNLTPHERSELANALRYELTLQATPDWEQLQEVSEYLASRNVGDGELVAWDDSTHPLYLMLNVKPGLRFMHVNTAAAIDYANSPGRIRDELNANTRARFVVSDLNSIGVLAELDYGITNGRAIWKAAPIDARLPPFPPNPVPLPGVSDLEFPYDRNPLLPANSPLKFPWDRRPLVYRSRENRGRYMVFELCQPIRATFERP